MLGRRAFLIEGSTWAAALTVGSSWLESLEACDGSQTTTTTATVPVESGPPPASSSAVCVGSAVPRAPRVPLHPDALARWVDPLPVPSVLRPMDGEGSDGGASGATREIRYRVTMREAEVKVHRDVPATRMWTYEGTVPGPIIEARSGNAIAVEWVNDLPPKHFLPVDHSLHGAHEGQPEVRAVVHVHGARVPAASDGYPEDWYPPGLSKVSTYPNKQDAATLWYHDHAMGIERLNQYAGLFGMYFLRDAAEDALELPSGPYEVPLVLFDRIFDADGALHYPTAMVGAQKMASMDGGVPSPWISEIYGDAHLVNGKIFPYFEVEPRAYRFRVVNASNSRFYYLSLSNGAPLTQIGSDQGLLAAPAKAAQLILAPAERVDLVVDFSAWAGQEVLLKSQAFELLQFRVAAAGDPPPAPTPLPAKLRPVTRFAASQATKTRMLTLNEYKHPVTHQMSMLLNATYWRQPVTENPELDSVEIWSLINTTEDSHPIHLHLVRFQILDRRAFDVDEYMMSGKMKLVGDPVPPPAGEAGWKDTVRADPGFITRIITRFEGYTGRYVWHCHVLEHAANEMMRPFEVIPRRS